MKLFRLVHAILREIFDEAAYERFCAQHRVEPGRISYSDFLRRIDRSANIRCC